MKIKYLVLIVSVFFLLNKPLFAEPINFKKLDWSMSIEGMIKTLESENYSCRKIGPNITCEDGKKKVNIFPSEGVITFNCQTFGGCQHELLILAQAGADKYKIELTPGTNEYGQPYYIGTGPDGDKIEFWKGKNSSGVVLYKGALGKKLNLD